MTNVQVWQSELGIPMIQLTGPAEESGAELAKKVMAAIYAHTRDQPELYPQPMSLERPCTLEDDDGPSCAPAEERHHPR